jgi:hypothetical protein
MPGTLRALLVAAVATGSVVAGVVLSRSPDREAEPPYESTPLTAYDTSDVTVARAGFCDATPAEAVAEALGSEPHASGGYGNGDRARITGAVRDVAHEYACTWRSSGATARAWMFAPPVTARRARTLVDAARDEAGCEAVRAAPDFGAPSFGAICEGRRRAEASYRGLFGDAWLTCELTASDATLAELTDRAGRWCVAVAEAARAR